MGVWCSVVQVVAGQNELQAFEIDDVALMNRGMEYR